MKRFPIGINLFDSARLAYRSFCSADAFDRNQIDLLRKSEQLIRDIRHLDNLIWYDRL